MQSRQQTKRFPTKLATKLMQMEENNRKQGNSQLIVCEQLLYHSKRPQTTFFK